MPLPSALLALPLLAQAAAPDPAAADATLRWIDAVGLGLVAVFALLGLVRGLWWQVARLAGIFAAVVLARALAPSLVPTLQGRWPELSERVAHGLAWFAVFLAALLLATLLGHLGRRLLEAMQLGTADRFGGAVAGAATGIAIHLALLVALCQLGTEPFVLDALSGSRSRRLVDLLAARWPVVVNAQASQEVRHLLRPTAPLWPAPPPPPHVVR